jgi:hypothetical protein
MSAYTAYLSFTLSRLRLLAKTPADDLTDLEERGRHAAMLDALGVFKNIAAEMSINPEDPNWPANDLDAFFGYLKNVFAAIRTLAANADRDDSDVDPRVRRYVSSLLWVLAMMQTSAKVLGFDLSLVGMDGADPYHDDLKRYRDR